MKDIRIVRFHLYEASKTNPNPETESRLVVAGDEGKEQGMTLLGMGLLLQGRTFSD